MKIPMYQIDVFTDRPFAGNPAAVCPLEGWPPDATLQAIAAENNLAETAFFLRGVPRSNLRWFTPTQEVDLCGHATMASAFVVFGFLDKGSQAVTFDSRSGPLSVRKDGERLSMTLPRRMPVPCETPAKLVEGLGAKPASVMRSRDYLAIYPSEADVRALRPDMGLLASVDTFGIIATSPGTNCDFVSRFFAPGAGVPEDPATGSSHCTLIPYWAQRLGKTRLHALQLSARGGEFFCEDGADTVTITGSAVLYLEGVAEIPSPER